MSDNTAVTKAEKLLALYALLSNRKIVPIAVAARFCKVTERTAYRYLNSLKDAGISVVFDKKNAGYRLDPAGDFPLTKLYLSDTVLLLLALDLLSRSVDDNYRDEIARLSQWIEATSDYKLGSIRRIIEGELPRLGPASEISSLISSLFIHAAIANDKAVNTLMQSSDNPRAISRVSQPRLVFDNRWSLISGDSHTECQVDISDIRKVIIH